MYATSSAISALNAAYVDVGTVLVSVVASVLAGLVALSGLGYGVQKVQEYITGRRDWMNRHSDDVAHMYD